MDSFKRDLRAWHAYRAKWVKFYLKHRNDPKLLRDVPQMSDSLIYGINFALASKAKKGTTNV